LLVVILLFATVVRLGWPGITEFKYDEATIARRALALVHEGIWPTRGVTSSLGIPHPPLTAYLLAIPFAVTRNPALAVVFLGALGVMAVGLTFVLGRRYFDERVGLIAAALFAASPWAIFYSRKIWSQNLPVVTLGFMLALYGLVVERNKKALPWMLVALGALMGLHLGGVAFAGILGLALILHPRSLKAVWPATPKEWGGALLGLAGMFILIAPYIAGIISSQAQIGSTLSSAGGHISQTSFSLLPLQYAAQIATGYQFHALAGSSFMDYYASLPLPDLSFLDLSEMGVIFAGLGYVIALAVLPLPKNDGTPILAGTPSPFPASRARYTLLALWIVLPVAMWTASGGAIFPHHFIQLYPAQHLVLAIFLVAAYDWLKVRLHKRTSTLLAGVGIVWLAALVGWQSVEYFGMLHFVDTHRTYGGHGVPAREIWETAWLARQFAAPEHLPIVIHTTGVNPDYEGGAAEFDALLGDFDLYLLEGDSMEVVPASAYVWIKTNADGSYTIEVRPPPQDGQATPQARLSNGMDLMSIAPTEADLRNLLTAGERLLLLLTWRVSQIPTVPDDYMFTVQLFTEDWQRWAQVDRPFLPTASWHVGDQVTTAVSLPVAEDAPIDGNYQLVIAIYSLQGGQVHGVDVLDSAGNVIGQQIIISLR
jgi:hypothetical protein